MNPDTYQDTIDKLNAAVEKLEAKKKLLETELEVNFFFLSLLTLTILFGFATLTTQGCSSCCPSQSE